MLAGVGSLTLMDDRLVTEEVLGANFLISLDEYANSNKTVAELCSQSLRDFNPMVGVSVLSGLSFIIYLFPYWEFIFSVNLLRIIIECNTESTCRKINMMLVQSYTSAATSSCCRTRTLSSTNSAPVSGPVTVPLALTFLVPMLLRKH